jgi:hypothetical protein
LVHLDHVERRNSFGDADDEFHASIGSFHDGVGGKCGSNKDHRRVATGFVAGFGDGVKNRQAFVHGSTFSWRDSTHNVGSVCPALQSVKSALATRDALHDQPRVLVD